MSHSIVVLLLLVWLPEAGQGDLLVSSQSLSIFLLFLGYHSLNVLNNLLFPTEKSLEFKVPDGQAPKCKMSEKKVGDKLMKCLISEPVIESMKNWLFCYNHNY